MIFQECPVGYVPALVSFSFLFCPITVSFQTQSQLHITRHETDWFFYAWPEFILGFLWFGLLGHAFWLWHLVWFFLPWLMRNIFYMSLCCIALLFFNIEKKTRPSSTILAIIIDVTWIYQTDRSGFQFGREIVIIYSNERIIICLLGTKLEQLSVALCFPF